MSQNITTVSEQWANRPDDQRFLTLDDLKASVLQRKAESWTAAPHLRNLRVVADNGKLEVDLYDSTHGERRRLSPTHWGFGQLSQQANCPAAYLRRLPSELAAINLQWGLEHDSLRSDALVLAQSNGTNSLRAMTSTSYGRIWDHQVVEAVERINQDGRWQIPAASYATTNPKRATTLYASDRDVFIFLVDPAHPVDIGGEQLFRGFYTWNSEVGAAVFGICTFLYRFVCDNRIIWDATEVKELRIRHTGGAPERFAYEARQRLARYSEESTAGLVEQIRRAKDFEIPKAAEKNGVASWLQARGFTKTVSIAAVSSAVAEEGQARSLWDVINGITAHARSIPNSDDRVALEVQAGKLMGLVAS